MTRKPVFAANWKLNHGPTQARAFMRTFLAAYPARDDRTVIFFPPALTLAAVHEAVALRSDIGLGVQNISTEVKGAFTGENSAPIAHDAGASFVLVGHSERRHVFGETDEQTARKYALARANGLTPVLCVGETLDQREAGDTNGVVLRQLHAGLSLVPAQERSVAMVAYEPVWAIGTGRTASPEDAAAVHTTIRAELRLMGASNDVVILYGGSVSPDNASGLLAARGVDGLLVGGSSLDPGTWLAIVSP